MSRRVIFLIVLILLFILVGPVALAMDPDPTGASTGTSIDVPATHPGSPTIEELANTIGHNRVAINFVWTLIAGFMVMFMQAGFAMVETGLTRAKNVAHTMAMNFMIYSLGMLGFWICGFGFMFGGVGPFSTLGGFNGLNRELTMTLFGKPFGLIGLKGFFLNGSVYDVAIFTMFLFQMVFMDTAATIPTGAMAERWKFSSFMVFGFFISMITYPIFGNWVWGGGWLSQLGRNFGLGHGHVDFAGSSVVHMVGGVTSLAGAMILGPRIGKYHNGTVKVIPGHNIPMAVTGTFILAFGWFGFNAGSTLSGTDLRIGVIATNTMLASAAGALSATLYMWWKFGKPDPSMMANGMLAGLVAITAPCAFVNSLSAVIIGGIAGILVIGSVFFVDRNLKVDDPVGAISVHGVNGAWGCIALGLFADGRYGDGLNGVAGGVRGLFYGDPSQLVAQLTGVVTNLIFVFTLSYVFFKILDRVVGLRVDPISEVEGLDIPEMGVLGYLDVKMRKEEINYDEIVSVGKERYHEKN
ncbi:MAG: ammonium transporter [Candidatus Atribacteria bacterium]|nr:ammonium transporter [Candidatus Atribacteria bacterium]